MASLIIHLLAIFFYLLYTFIEIQFLINLEGGDKLNLEHYGNTPYNNPNCLIQHLPFSITLEETIN